MIIRYTLLLIMLVSITPDLLAFPGTDHQSIDTVSRKQIQFTKTADSIHKITDSIHKPSVSIHKITDSINKSTDSINHKRLTPVIISGAAIYAGSMTMLYQFWYKNYPQSSFHFFNDNKEWLQMDKVGHVTTAYYISKASYNTLRWTGLSEKQSILYGGGMGFFYQTAIEILDGFSAEWGFSTGDILANTLGSGIFLSQQLAWKEQRLQLKWSFHPSVYAKYRPDLMGRRLDEQWIKDYNGQTYWLSANIKSFLPKENKFPPWLNLAIGYGAEGMTGAEQNSSSYQGVSFPTFNRYRQFYLSGDIDISHIKTRSKTLHLILNTLSFIKIPFPTLEFSQGKIMLHPLYF